MTQTATMKRTGIQVDFAAPAMPLSDITHTTEAAVLVSLGYCAQEMGLDTVDEVINCLRTGNCNACGYLHYSLAEQVAEYLGNLDQDVKAVYICDYDATPEDVCFAETTAPLIHLIVWSQRKTAALNALVGVLDRALLRSYGDAIGVTGLTHLLDVQVIDDVEVRNRAGYGAAISSLYHRPIEVWKR